MGTPIRPEPTESRWPYLPALDGLRAVAVGAVLLYHLELGNGRAAGGYLGVEVFFVVSGFLITGLLLDEGRRTGTVGLRQFWIRRARRLLPAVVVLIGVVLAWSAVMVPDELATFRGDGLAGLLYVQNWWAIVADTPYFAAFGRPSPLRHLWSLSIEEQFYVVWPVAVLVAMRRMPRPVMVGATVAAAAASVWWMSRLASVDDIERAYYGTDTRAFGLLVGAVLAMVWRPAGPDGLARSVFHRRSVDVVGVVALAALVLQMDTRSEFDPWTFPFGLAWVDVLTVVLIVVAGTPGSWLSAALGNQVLVELGKRSYSLYLWHWPLFVFTRPGSDIALTGWSASVWRLLMAAVLAEASYRLVETPFRDGRAQAWIASQRVARPRWGLAALGALVAVAMALTAAVAWVGPSASDDEKAASPSAPEAAMVAAVNPPVAIAPATTEVPSKSPGAVVESTPSPEAGPSLDPVVGAADPPAVTGDQVIERSISAIGDSVLLGAEDGLKARFAVADVDAEIARQVAEVVDLVEARASAGSLGEVVVVHAGTNGTIPGGGLDRILAAVGPGRTLVLVTVSVPRRWEQEVNDNIRRFARDHPEVALAEWSEIGSEPGLKREDDVHLTEEGKARYVQMLVDVIAGLGAATPA